MGDPGGRVSARWLLTRDNQGPSVGVSAVVAALDGIGTWGGGAGSLQLAATFGLQLQYAQVWKLLELELGMCIRWAATDTNKASEADASEADQTGSR